MGDVTDFISQQKIEEVRDKLSDNLRRLDCEDIAEGEDLKTVGVGNTRCAFATDDPDVILKIARNEDGITGNKRATNVLLVDDELAERTFALPLDIDNSGVALTQENVTRLKEVSDLEELDVVYKTDVLEDASMDRGQRVRRLEKILRDQLDEVFEDAGFRCLDVLEANMGVKDDRPVLTDLGECKFPSEEV